MDLSNIKIGSSYFIDLSLIYYVNLFFSKIFFKYAYKKSQRFGQFLLKTPLKSILISNFSRDWIIYSVLLWLPKFIIINHTKYSPNVN